MNKTALVTGGSHNIGQGIAIVLAEHGYDVAITYNSRKDGAVETQKEIEKLGRKCFIYQASLEKPEVPQQIVDQAHKDLGGRLDLMVCNQAVDNTIAVEDVRARMRECYPLAAPKFEQALAETGVAEDDRVTVSPARMRKMASRSFRTESGIEIKIPAELCSSDEAVEFIHTATGGLSLLIKDVLV